MNPNDVETDDLLPRSDFDTQWALLIVSGVFFTYGSYAFVHAFEEPPKEPFFKQFKHFQTDELLGAWLFLFGTIPAVPYMLILFINAPSAFAFMGLLAAIVFVVGSILFVKSCYPSDKVSHVAYLCMHTPCYVCVQLNALFFILHILLCYTLFYLYQQ